jgi:hypothetical protein
MKERDIEEIQQYLLEVFNESINRVEINYTVWEKKDNISFKQFMLDYKETLKKELEELIAEGCTEDIKTDVNYETLYFYDKIDDMYKLVSLDDTQYIKEIEYWMKSTAISYLDVCCRDRTYNYDDIVMD